MSKPLAVGIAVVIGLILVIQAFTAEGYPATPTLSSPTQLNGGTQVFVVTFTTTAYGTSPINSIDEQGARAQYSVFQNGNAVAVNQSVALNTISTSGFLDTLQGQAAVGLPTVTCPSGAVCSESVAVTARVSVLAWTGVYNSAWVNVTFSNLAAVKPAQSPASTPIGTFAFNFGGAISILVAAELTIFLVAFPRPMPLIVGDVAAGVATVVLFTWSIVAH